MIKSIFRFASVGQPSKMLTFSFNVVKHILVICFQIMHLLIISAITDFQFGVQNRPQIGTV